MRSPLGVHKTDAWVCVCAMTYIVGIGTAFRLCGARDKNMTNHEYH